MKFALRNTFIAAAGLLVSIWVGIAHPLTSASYQITRSVISSGGGSSASASCALTGTLGQPSPVEVSQSDSYNLGSQPQIVRAA